MLIGRIWMSSFLSLFMVAGRATSEIIAIKADGLIDGAGAAWSRNAVLLVEGDRIAAI